MPVDPIPAVDYFKTAADIGTVLAGFAATISLFWLARQVRSSIDEAKISRSHTFITRYNDPVWGKMVADARILLRQKENYIKMFDWEDDNRETTTMRQTVIISLNFFEEMGELYNRNMLNKELIEDFFSYVSKDYYKAARDWIESGIKRADTSEITPVGLKKIYKEWREMNETFISKGL